MKRFSWKRCFLLLLPLLLLTRAARAEEDIRSFALDSLTEVYGYTAQEAASFIISREADGVLRLWPRAHPDWAYTAYTDKQGRPHCDSPFGSDYAAYPGESAVRDTLRKAGETGWFSHWNGETAREMEPFFLEQGIVATADFYLSQTPSQAVQSFFESCYGPEAGWRDAVKSFRDSVLLDYGLAPETVPFHVQGTHTIASRLRYENLQCTVYLFEGEAPEELQAALSDSHLAGWTLQSGAAFLLRDTITHDLRIDYGLAAYEKDGKRMLVMLSGLEGEWKVYPLGKNALYQTGDYRITYRIEKECLAVDYRLSEQETATFYLKPYVVWRGVGDENAYCEIAAYERINRETGEALWLNVSGTVSMTWQNETRPDDPLFSVPFPPYLGAAPIEDFPTTLDAAAQYMAKALPEGCVISTEVNLRAKTSSHSKSYGLLRPGALLPVLERLPGDPHEWIHTRIGFLEGYVTAIYTQDAASGVSAGPLPQAMAKGEIALKHGTGPLDGTVARFPAGTAMHIVLENGNWLYVCVPRDGIQYFMDLDGTFGYVKKTDVTAFPAGLGWEE